MNLTYTFFKVDCFRFSSMKLSLTDSKLYSSFIPSNMYLHTASDGV